MSWLQDHKFQVSLATVALVASAGLYVYGSKGSGRYERALQEFQEATSQAAEFERLALYPTKANLDSKRIAVDEYRKATQSLQAAFDAYRPKPGGVITPQAFTDLLKSANQETRAAFAGRMKFPDDYFCGYMVYKKSLAPGDATSILAYQLNGIKALMTHMVDCGVSRLINIHRPILTEEEGVPYNTPPGQVARPLPLELTFEGPEKSIRAFLSSVAAVDERYVVIRTIRIANARRSIPKTTDAKFDRPSEAAASSPTAPIAELFADSNGTATGDNKAPATPAPAAADSSRMLEQVLGNETLQVFLRIDLMQFLPTKDLP